MGKKNKKKRRRISEADRPTTTTEATATSADSDRKAASNPLLQGQSAFMNSLSKLERTCFFSNTQVTPERRAELWMQQADVGQEMVSQYSWATPDSRAMAILRHFSPLIEIGCGANAYWCRQMVHEGLDVIGYDRDPKGGGRLPEATGPNVTTDFVVQKGGPEVLKRKEHSRRTLFLCYPDEDDDQEVDEESESSQEPVSMGAACLRHYKGDHVIHVGELFRDTTLSMEQAPWGRSSSPEFQQLLAESFHCVLHVALPNWLHTRDSLSVWKRSETCTLVFAAEDEDDQDEEVQYRHVPVEERLPTDVAAPYLAHLLTMPLHHDNQKADHLQVENDSKKYSKVPTGASSPGSSDLKKAKEKKQGSPRQSNSTTNNTGADDYECPW